MINGNLPPHVTGNEAYFNEPDVSHLCTRCLDDEVHRPDEWVVDCGEEKLCEHCVENEICADTMIPWDKLCEFFKGKYKDTSRKSEEGFPNDVVVSMKKSPLKVSYERVGLKLVTPCPHGKKYGRPHTADGG